MTEEYRVNIRIPLELWQAVKTAAALERKTLTDVVHDWALEFVKNTEKKYKITLLVKEKSNGEKH